MPTIDIKKKCPNSQTGSTGPCEDDNTIEAEKGALPGSAVNYGYVTHSGLSGPTIKEITYGGRSLEIEDANGKSTAFSKEYPNLEKVTTYYYTQSKDNENDVQIPLVLRVYGGGAHHLYLNKNTDRGNTTWKHVPLKGLDRIPSGNTTTPELTSRLKSQACRLHRLHKIDVRYGNSGSNIYTCPVCKKTKLGFYIGTLGQTVDCYKKFCHTLLGEDDKIIHPVTYGNELIKYKEGNTWKLFSATKSDCDTLSVFYWEGDDKRVNPLLIEVKSSGNESTWYENTGTSGNTQHDKWIKLELGEAGKLSSSKVDLKNKLDILSCIFNGTVRIQLGRHSACHTSNDNRHKDRLNIRTDGTFHRELLLSSCEYTQSKVSGSGSFHVSEFYLSDQKQMFKSAKFFKNVTKVTAYVSSCDSSQPFLLSVEYGTTDRKWYKRIKTNTWEDCDINGQLEGIFKSAQSTLGIQACEKKSSPLTGLHIDIKRQPTGDKLGSIYIDSGSGKIPIALVKTLDSPVRGFFRVTHRVSTDTGSFIVSNTLGNRDIIREGTRMDKPIEYAQYVEIYFGNSSPDLPILIAINKSSNGNTQYYSYGISNVGGISKGTWAQRGYSDLTSAELNEMLDDQNCHRNGAIPIDFKYPTNLKRFYSKISSSNLRNKSVKNSGTPQNLPSGASDYEVEAYDITPNNIRISRVTYNGKPTNIITTNEAMSQLRIYKWKNDPNPADKVPLLVEFLKTDGKHEWFENLTKESLHWQRVEPEEALTFYEQTTIQEALTAKLDEVSCNIHHTVRIDVSKKSNAYCHKRCIPKG